MALENLTTEALADKATRLAAAVSVLLHMRNRLQEEKCPEIALNTGNLDLHTDEVLTWLDNNSGAFEARLKRWVKLRDKVLSATERAQIAAEIKHEDMVERKKRK